MKRQRLTSNGNYSRIPSPQLGRKSQDGKEVPLPLQWQVKAGLLASSRTQGWDTDSEEAGNQEDMWLGGQVPGKAARKTENNYPGEKDSKAAKMFELFFFFAGARELTCFWNCK